MWWGWGVVLSTTPLPGARWGTHRPSFPSPLCPSSSPGRETVSFIGGRIRKFFDKRRFIQGDNGPVGSRDHKHKDRNLRDPSSPDGSKGIRPVLCPSRPASTSGEGWRVIPPPENGLITDRNRGPSQVGVGVLGEDRQFPCPKPRIPGPKSPRLKTWMEHRVERVYPQWTTDSVHRSSPFECSLVPWTTP